MIAASYVKNVISYKKMDAMEMDAPMKKQKPFAKLCLALELVVKYLNRPHFICTMTCMTTERCLQEIEVSFINSIPMTKYIKKCPNFCSFITQQSWMFITQLIAHEYS